MKTKGDILAEIEQAEMRLHLLELRIEALDERRWPNRLETVFEGAVDTAYYWGLFIGAGVMQARCVGICSQVGAVTRDCGAARLCQSRNYDSGGRRLTFAHYHRSTKVTLIF